MLHKELPSFGKVATKELQPVSSKKVTQCWPDAVTYFMIRSVNYPCYNLKNKRNMDLERLAAGEWKAGPVACDVGTFVSAALSARECDEVCGNGDDHVCSH